MNQINNKAIIQRSAPTCTLLLPPSGTPFYIWQECGKGAYVPVQGFAVCIVGYETLDFFTQQIAEGDEIRYDVRDGYTGQTWGTGATCPEAVESARRTLHELHDLIPHSINFHAAKRGLSPRYATT